MASVLFPQDVRAHLRLDTDADDDLLTLYTGAAWDYVRAFTGAPWPANVATPDSVNAAVLLLVADLYENREAQGVTALHQNRTVERLLWPHREF